MVGCKLVYPCYQISLTMSVCILGIMSIDRCRSIIWPLRNKFQRRTIHVTVAASFCGAVTLQWYQFVELTLLPEGRCSLNRTNPLYAIPRLFEVFFRDGVFLFVFTGTTVLIYVSLSRRDFKAKDERAQKV